MKYIEKALIALLIAALTLIPAALAENGEGVVMTMPDVVSDVYLAMDDDEALEGYLQSQLGITSGGLFAARNLGKDLPAMAKKIYDKLTVQIARIASGELASTEVSISVSDLGASSQTYTASMLGVSKLFDSNGKLTSEADAAFKATLLSETDYNKLIRALLWDHPYEMYWFNKTYTSEEIDSTTGEKKKNGPVSSSYPSHVKYSSSVSWSSNSNMVFRFRVSDAYAGSGDYTVNTTKTKDTQNAVNKAISIRDQYASATDYDKLKGYKEQICELVSYNKSAAGSGGTNYGDPWQVIYVFDGKATTNVVCEGYAKAFQYLCDMTTFTDNNTIVCYTATGDLIDGSERGGHMWNIVHMPDGNNYHVDVTNCDTGSAGAPDKLFMVGCANGSPSKGYTFDLGKSSLGYEYDNNTKSLFSTAELTLSATDYVPVEGLAVNEANFPDEAFRSAVAALVDSNGDNILTDAEIAAVTSLNVSGKGIASLTGIENLTALTSLNCSNNSLTELDVSVLPALTTLDASGNKLNTLDVSKNSKLANIANRSVSGSAKTYTKGSATVKCDLGVRLVSGYTPTDVATLPADLKTVGANAFRNIGVERVVIPSGCTSIGDKAFANCANLTEVVIPASVTSIADYAFSGSPDVFIISPSATVRQWAQSHNINSAAQ